MEQLQTYVDFYGGLAAAFAALVAGFGGLTAGLVWLRSRKSKKQSKNKFQFYVPIPFELICHATPTPLKVLEADFERARYVFVEIEGDFSYLHLSFVNKPNGAESEEATIKPPIAA